MSEYRDLVEAWLVAKESERQATETRRDIEDKLSSLLGISENMEGTQNALCDEYKIKITGRHTRKVDSDKLQDLANENGISALLSVLFRWKAEINTPAWKNADEEVTRILAPAITTTAGRLSFNITKEQ